jgi:hypothetical protein
MTYRHRTSLVLMDSELPDISLPLLSARPRLATSTSAEIHRTQSRSLTLSQICEGFFDCIGHFEIGKLLLGLVSSIPVVDKLLKTAAALVERPAESLDIIERRQLRLWTSPRCKPPGRIGQMCLKYFVEENKPHGMSSFPSHSVSWCPSDDAPDSRHTLGY